MINQLLEKYLTEMADVRRGEKYRIMRGFEYERISYRKGGTFVITDVRGSHIIVEYDDGFHRIGDDIYIDETDFVGFLDNHVLERK